jgi:hypothetical protein
MICVQKYQDFVSFFYQVAISMLFVEKYIHIEIMLCMLIYSNYKKNNTPMIPIQMWEGSEFC